MNMWILYLVKNLKNCKNLISYRHWISKWLEVALLNYDYNLEL